VAKGKAHGRDIKASNRTWEIRPSGIIGGPRKTWPGRNCEPTSQPKRVRVITLRLKQTRPSSIPTMGRGSERYGLIASVTRKNQRCPSHLAGLWLTVSSAAFLNRECSIPMLRFARASHRR
jgi:hypothetical protein